MMTFLTPFLTKSAATAVRSASGWISSAGLPDNNAASDSLTIKWPNPEYTSSDSGTAGAGLITT